MRAEMDQFLKGNSRSNAPQRQRSRCCQSRQASVSSKRSQPKIGPDIDVVAFGLDGFINKESQLFAFAGFDDWAIKTFADGVKEDCQEESPELARRPSFARHAVAFACGGRLG